MTSPALTLGRKITTVKKLAIALATLAVMVTGCSSYAAAHNHNAPTAVNDVHPDRVWHYINSPGSFQTIIYTCIGTEGFYETQDNAYPIVIVPQDPMCGYVGSRFLFPAK